MMIWRIRSALTLSLLITAGLSNASASPIEIVFSNVASPGGAVFGPACCQVGNEVTLGGTSRDIVGVSWLIDTQNTNLVTGFETWIYANDGLGGAPGTLLWDSGALIGLPISATDTILNVTVPHILVPDVITVTSLIFDTAPVALGRVIGGPPTVGSVNAVWLEDAGVWAQQSSAFIFGLSVSAEPVPEPSTVWLVLGGVVAFVGLSRRRRALVGTMAINRNLSHLRVRYQQLRRDTKRASGRLPWRRHTRVE